MEGTVPPIALSPGGAQAIGLTEVCESDGPGPKATPGESHEPFNSTGPSAWLLGAAAAALVVCGCSSAPSISSIGSPFGSSSSVDRTFVSAAQTWDFDKDGTVTCDEWKNYLTSLVRESDGNGDGCARRSEFERMAKTDQLFTVADRSYYDARATAKSRSEEMTGKQNAAFKQLDKNNDCRSTATNSPRVAGRRA